MISRVSDISGYVWYTTQSPSYYRFVSSVYPEIYMIMTLESKLGGESENMIRSSLHKLPQILLCSGHAYFWQHDSVSTFRNLLPSKQHLPVSVLDTMVMNVKACMSQTLRARPPLTQVTRTLPESPRSLRKRLAPGSRKSLDSRRLLGYAPKPIP